MRRAAVLFAFACACACPVLGCAGTAPPSGPASATPPLPPIAPLPRPTAAPPVAQVEVEDAGEPPDATATAQTRPAAIATRIESFYAGALPMECDLTAETFVKSRNTRQTSRLHLVFARPGKFHVTMIGGPVIAVDAQNETIFDPATQQGTQRPVAADHCPIAFAYAAGAGVLAKKLSLEAYDGAAMNAPGMDILVGSSNVMPLASSRVKVVYYVDTTGLVKRSLVIVPGGDRHRYDVVTCKMHATPPASLFAFRLPGAAQPMAQRMVPIELTEPLP